MKTRITIFGVALLLLLASCFSPLQEGNSDGSVTVGIPSLEESGLSASELSASATPSDSYYARVFIYKQGSEAGYGEVRVSGETPSELTIRGIPEGDDYSLVVTIGRKAAGALFPERYGINSGGTFQIAGGRATSVTIDVQASPFFYTLPGESLKGVARDAGGALVTATESTVYAIAPPATFSRYVGATASVAAGFSIASVGQGVVLRGSTEDIGWVSGPGTIYQPHFNGIDAFGGAAERANLIPTGAFDTAPDILSNVGYADEAAGDVIAMFQVDGGLGGGQVRTAGQPGSASSWGDTGSELKDVVAGQPVYDIAIWNQGANSRAIFATQLGAFVATEALFDTTTEDELTEAFLTGTNITGMNFIEFTAGGQTREITAATAYGNRLFLGTARGVFMVNTDNANVADLRIDFDAGEAVRMPGTQGMQVADLELIGDGSGQLRYVAALGRSKLVVRRFPVNGVTAATATVPVVAGVPGVPALGGSNSGVKGMTFARANGTVYLAFAGEFGFSALDLASIF